MQNTPYTYASNQTPLTTLGSNPISFSYVSTAQDATYYPPANATVTMGPMKTPQIYAKDLNVLEIGSSGQVVMSMQDQASVSWSNDPTNTITYLQGANNNALFLQPGNSNATTVLGEFRSERNGLLQQLSTTQSNGFLGLRPMKLSQTLDTLDRTVLQRTIDVCGAVMLRSVLLVQDRAILAGGMTGTGNATLMSTLTVQSRLTTLGSTEIQGNLSIQGNVLLQKTLDVNWNVVLYSTLSMASGSGMRAGSVTVGVVNVNAITSTGTISFANQAVMLKGVDVLGHVTFRSTVSVQDRTSFQRTLDVSGATMLGSILSISSNGTLQGTLVTKDATVFAGATSIASRVSIGAPTKLQGASLDASGALTLGSSLSLQGTLYVGQRSRLGSSLSVTSNVSIRGTADASGVMTLGDDLLIRSSGGLSVSNIVQLQSSLLVRGTTAVFAEPGDFQNMYYVHTKDGYLVSSATYGYSDAWSVCFWVRYVTSTASARIFDSRTLSPEVDGFFLEITNGVTSMPLWQSYPTTLNDQRWHFLTFVRETGTVDRFVLYEDGQQKTTQSTSVISYQLMTRPKFGSDQGNSLNTSQNLYYDEISIFNAALTPTQVQAIYNNGIPQDVRTVTTTPAPVSYWRLETVQNGNRIPDMMGFSTLDYYVGATPTNLTLTAHDATVQPSGAKTMSLYVLNTANRVYLAKRLSMGGAISMDGSANVQGFIETRANLSVQGVSRFVGVPVDNAYYSLYSMVFDGTTKAVATTQISRSNVPFSISMWFKAASSGNVLSPDRPKLFDGRWTSGAGSSTIELSSINQIAVWGANASLNWTDDQWHHIVVATDGVNSIKRYVDGQFVGSGVFSPSQLTLESVTLGTRYSFEGVADNPSHWFRGFIDEVAIFTVQLTDPQVTEVYGGGRAIHLLTSSAANTLIAYWKMENNGTNSVPMSTNHLIPTNVTYTNATTATSTKAPVLGDPFALMIRSPLEVMGGSVQLGSTLSVSDALQLQRTLTAHGAVNAKESIVVSSSLMVAKGVSSMGSTLSLAGMSTLGSTLEIRSAARIQSTLSVYESTKFDQTLQGVGPVRLASLLSVGTILDAKTQVRLSSTLTVSGSGTLMTTLYASEPTLLRDRLSVGASMDALGNVTVGGFGTFQSDATMQAALGAATTLTVARSSTFATDVKSDTYRPLSTNASKVVTIDASKTVILGNVDIVGTLNTIDTVDAMRVQDKSIRLSTDPSGGQHVDGTLVNHNAGLFIDGLPSGVASDPQNQYEKSFAWKYDPVNGGASWSSLGTNSSTNTVLPFEPSWMMRGGSFKIANYRDASNGAMFTMRINSDQEFEGWRSLLVNNRWDHTRVTRFGATKTVVPTSVISAFVAILGAPTQTTSSLSLKITSVTDTLYSTKNIIPYYTVTQVSLESDSQVTYNAPVNLSIAMFSADTTGTVPNAVSYEITDLPSNTLFTKVRARISNQYGVFAVLTTTLASPVPTLDASGPQVVNSISVTPDDATLSLTVVLSTFDVGLTTTNYKVVLFASTLPTYTTTGITDTTANVYSYTGTGKTSQTAYTNTQIIAKDLTGASLVPGTPYYLYYVLYDPLGNRTTNGLEAKTAYTLTEIKVYYSNFKSLELAGDAANAQYSEVMNWAPSTDTGTGLTVSTWIYPRTNTVANTVFVLGDKNFPSTSAGAHISLTVGAGDRSLLATWGTTSSDVSYNAAPTIYNEWHHVACTYERNQRTNARSLNLNGSSQYGSTNMTAWFPTFNFTVSAWIRRSATGKRDSIYHPYGIAAASNSVTPGYLFCVETTDKVTVFDGSYSTVTGSTSLQTNRWYHVAYAWNASDEVKIYVNGLLDGQGTLKRTTFIGNVDLDVGRDWNRQFTFEYFQGSLDEVGLWNTALDASAISAVYNAGQPFDLRSNQGFYTHSTGLSAYYRFESMDGTNFVQPKTGQSVNFVRSANKIMSGAALFTPVRTQPFTISVWFKWNGGAAGVQHELITFGTPASTAVNPSNVALLQIQPESYSFGVWGVQSITLTNPTPPTNTWMHVIFVNRPASSNTAFYINGNEYIKEAYTGTYTGTNIVSIGNIWSFYNSGASTYAFDGLIDEVGIFNTALTAVEASAIYNLGAPLNLLTNAGDYQSSSALQAYYQFNNADGTDSSINTKHLTTYSNTFSTDVPGRRDLTFVGSPTFSTDAPGPLSISFTTSTQYAFVDMTGWMLYKNYTVSAWIKLSATNLVHTIYHPYAISGNTYNHSFRVNDDNYLRFLNQTPSIWSVQGTSLLTSGVWYHVAVTRDVSNNVRLYLNGKLENANITGTPGDSDSYQGTIELDIGRGYTRINENFRGSLDDYSIWNTTLSAAQIAEIYNNGTPKNLQTHSAYAANIQAYWRFESNTGNDTTNYARHLSLAGSPTFSTDIPENCTGKLYLDGSLVATRVGNPLIHAIRPHVSIGRGYESGAFTTTYFKGSIDEMSIFNAPLTAAEVVALYNNANPPNVLKHSRVADLQAYWQMQDFTGITNQYDDKSGYNRHLTVNYSGTKVPQLTTNTSYYTVETKASFTPSAYTLNTQTSLTPDRTKLIVMEFVSGTTATIRAFETTTYTQLWSVTYSFSTTLYAFIMECVSNNVLVIAYNFSYGASTIYVDRVNFTNTTASKDTATSTSFGSTMVHVICGVTILDDTGKYIVHYARSGYNFNGGSGQYTGKRFYANGTLYDTLTWNQIGWDHPTNISVVPIYGTGSGWDLIAATVQNKSVGSSNNTLYYIFGSGSGIVSTIQQNIDSQAEIYASTVSGKTSSGNILLEYYRGNPRVHTLVLVNGITGAYISARASMDSFSSLARMAPFKAGALRFVDTSTFTHPRVQYIDETSTTQLHASKTPFLSYYATRAHIYTLEPNNRYLTFMYGSTTVGSGDQSYKFVEINATYEPPVEADGIIDTSGAVAAYGLRKVVSSYTGPVALVQRSGDSAYADVYMDACKNVTQATLSSNAVLTPHNITSTPTVDGEGYYVITSPWGVTQRIKASSWIDDTNDKRLAWHVLDGTTTFGAGTQRGWLSLVPTAHIIYDLGAIHTITAVQYVGYSESNNRWPGSYIYYWSNNGFTWTQYTSRTGITNGNGVTITDTTLIVAQYLKLEYTRPLGNEDVVGIMELEVRGLVGVTQLSPHDMLRQTTSLITPNTLSTDPPIDAEGFYTFSAPTVAGVTQRIKASSTNTTRVSWHVFDGFTTYSVAVAQNRYGWLANASSGNLILDLGQTFHVAGITFYGYGESTFWPTSYSYYASNDGVTWGSAIATRTGITSGANKLVAASVAVNTRYLRFDFTSGGTYVGIHELRVQGIPIDTDGFYVFKSPLNISQRIKASTETSSTGAGINVLNHGYANVTSYTRREWRSASQQTAHLIYDLGTSYTVTSIKHVGGGSVTDWPVSYTYSWSNDGSTWTSYATRTGITNGNTTDTTETTRVTTRYLKLEYTSANGNTTVSVSEIEIQGYAALTGTSSPGSEALLRFSAHPVWRTSPGNLSLINWYDQTGNNKHLNIPLTANPITSASLTNLVFNGSTTGLYLNYGVLPAGQKEYTMTALWKMDSGITVSPTIIEQATFPYVANTRSALSLSYTTSHAINFYGGNNNVEITPAINYNTIYRTVLQVNNSLSRNIELSANGSTYVTNTPTPSTLSIGSDRFYVGIGVGEARFKGVINEVIVFNKNISIAQESQLETWWKSVRMTSYVPFYEYEFIVNVQSNNSGNVVISEIKSVNYTLLSSQIYPMYTYNTLSSTIPFPDFLVDGYLPAELGTDPAYVTFPTVPVGVTVFKLVIPSTATISQFQVTFHRYIYMPGFKIRKNGVDVLTETANGGTDSVSETITKTYNV